MALVELRNVSNHLVTLRLNSGQTLILESGASQELVEQEVQGNDKVKKLTDQGVIGMQAKGRQNPAEKAEKSAAGGKGAIKKVIKRKAN